MRQQEEKAKTVLAQLFAKGGNIRDAARFANVSIRTAQRLSSPSYVEKHPNVKAWYEQTFSSEDIAVEKCDQELAAVIHMPKEMYMTNPAMAAVKVKGIELGYKRKGVLQENKNVNVSVTDYTAALQEAWRIREERIKKAITIEAKVLPAPTNSGSSPINELNG